MNYDTKSDPCYDLTYARASQSELSEWNVAHIAAPEWMVAEGLADKGQLVWVEADTGALIG